VLNALVAILKGELPPKGSWITNGKAVCDVCVRNPRNTDEKREIVKEVRRTIDGDPDENKCLLQQGYMCLGPITQGDCGALCPKVNIPCAGCGGPIPGVKDFGLRAVSAIASLLDSEDLVNQIPSPVKLFYRYSLPSSMLGKKVKKV
jgi:F420-non-reducing hydrogenase small subunit